jgi:hypothetical protein
MRRETRLPGSGVNVRLMLPRLVWAVGAVLILVLLAFFTRAWWYTPSVTQYALNDTTRVVTLDDCADVSVTLSPGEKTEIQPFADATRAPCTVFEGDSDQDEPIGCLAVPSSHGHTTPRAVVRVSTMHAATHDHHCR